MPKRKQKDKEPEPQEMKLLKAFECALLYRLYASLHSSSPSAEQEQSRELAGLVAIARSYIDKQVQLIWPGLGDADIMLRCEEIKQKLAPVAASFSSVMQKVRPIVRLEGLPPDDPVEYLDSVDIGKILMELRQGLEKLMSPSLSELLWINQQLAKLKGEKGDTKLTDLWPRITWIVELAFLLKLAVTYFALLYSAYGFAAWTCFVYTLSEVLTRMQKSGQGLRDFVFAENGLSDEYWRTQLRPALVNVSRDASLPNVLTIENEAIVEFMKARHKLGGDMEKAIGTLWDLGVIAGGKPIRWSEVIALLHEVQANEKLRDSLYRLITTLDDYIDKKEFDAILEEGTEGRLLNSLKKATRK